MTSYYWENLECEICKSHFSQCVEIGGQQVDVLKIDKPSTSCYLVIESEVEGVNKAIHVVDFTVKQHLLIGRRVSNEISISDISVSREQARIVYMEQQQEVYLIDMNSKFGTFLKI